MALHGIGREQNSLAHVPCAEFLRPHSLVVAQIMTKTHNFILRNAPLSVAFRPDRP